jgi:uncharacterized protein YkwD
MAESAEKTAPNPSRDPAGDRWYYLEKTGVYTHEKGPFTCNEMRRLFTAGAVDPSTPVRSGDMTFWCPASRVSAFSDLTKGTHPVSRRMLVVLAATTVVLGGLLLLNVQRESASVRGTAAPRAAVKTVPAPLPAALSAADVITCTNRARHETSGMPPLSENLSLNEIARQRLDDMLRKQYFAHVSPSGDSAPEVAQRTGYAYKYLGENIAMGHFATVDKMVQTWMQSPSHRKNILTDKCSEIGVAVGKGVMDGEEAWVGVQIFGQSAAVEITHKSQ